MEDPESPTAQQGGHYTDPALRWRCKESRCGAAFLTREQLRTHMKMGVHGVGAPPVAEIVAASQERRSLRAPPVRAGGYGLRGGREPHDDDDGYTDRDRDTGSEAASPSYPLMVSSPSPDEVNKVSMAMRSPMSPHGIEMRLNRSIAEKEALRLKEQEEEVGQFSLVNNPTLYPQSLAFLSFFLIRNEIEPLPCPHRKIGPERRSGERNLR